MASHHYPHHPHHHYHPTTTTTSSTVCHCRYPPPPPPVPDPYLPNYHHHHHPNPQTHSYNPYPNAPIVNPNPVPPCTNQRLPHHHQVVHQQQTECCPISTGREQERYFRQVHHDQQRGEFAHDHPTVSSLLLRIAALESSLRSHSYKRYHSLRDAAARTIQTHFRAFLVRRSRTLRQLKELASIKSTLNVLQSSVSGNTRFDPQALHHKASRLLFRLDAIQGGDPMIRDGKRSISRELNRFMDVIDGFIDERCEISSKLIKKNVVHKKMSNDHKREVVRSHDSASNKTLEDLVSRVDALYGKIPEEDDDEEEIVECHEVPTIKRISNPTNEAQAKVKKNVRFVENGKVYQVSRNGDFDDGNENDSLTRKAEVGGISSKITEDDEDEESHDGDSTKSSDGEEGPTYEVRTEDGNFIFSAPVTVTMDSRTDSMSRRKLLK